MVLCDNKIPATFPTDMLTSQRIYPPQEPRYSGDVAGGYMRSCLPFAVGATVTVVVVSLDIVTDWIMHHAIVDIGIPDKVREYTANRNRDGDDENEIIWTLRDVYERLPNIMLGFLILSSMVFCLYFWWLCYMFVEQRKKFKDKRDGVPRKQKACERYGGEILILLHVLCEDLPVSVILLLAQISCSCTFLLDFDHVIYLIATCTTAVSLSWKFVQVIWNFGCFNFRENYLCSNGLVTLRTISLLFISFTWSLTAINFVLLSAGKNGELFSHSTFRMSVFDKIGVDRYVQSHYIVFTQSSNFKHIAVSNSFNAEKLSGLNDTHLLTITPVKAVVDAIDSTYTVSLPCQTAQTNITFTPYLKELHREEYSGLRNCSVIFRFRLQSLSNEIHYDARVLLFDDRLDDCVSERVEIDSSHIVDLSPSKDSEEAFTPELPHLSTASEEDQGSSQTSNAINSSGGPDNLPSRGDSAAATAQQLQSSESHTQQNYLSFISYLSRNKYKSCSLRLVPNVTLLSESDVCVYTF